MSDSADAKLRKAAILIASLDTAAADALLQQMPPQQEARVRAAVMELEQLDADEQQQVIQEFVNRTPHHPTAETDDVQLDESLVRRLQDEAEQGGAAADELQSPARPFESLRHVEAKTLANLLIREHPQTISIVLSHLPAEHAAKGLSHLPAHLQTEVLMRIARLATPAPEILQDIEAEMQSQLSRTSVTEPFDASGLAAVQAILSACRGPQRQQCVDQLAHHDHHLLNQLRSQAGHPQTQWAPSPCATTDREQPAGGYAPHEPYRPEPATPPALEFADLEQMEDAILARVLERAGPHCTLLALAGASSQLVQRILRYLPPPEAARLQQQMSQLGPIRLDDIERAQQQLVAVAQRLLSELPEAGDPQRFMVAA